MSIQGQLAPIATDCVVFFLSVSLTLSCHKTGPRVPDNRESFPIAPFASQKVPIFAVFFERL
jgi:hypothetical protein